MRKEPFIVDLREYHNNFDFLIPAPPSGHGISKLPECEDNATIESLAVDNFICPLNQSIVRNPNSTFVGVARGMMLHKTNNIYDGDVIVIDRNKKPAFGSVGIYLRDGRYVLRCLVQGWDADIWGMVVSVLKTI